MQVVRFAVLMILPVVSPREPLQPHESSKSAFLKILNVSERSSPPIKEVGLYFMVDSNVKPAFGLSVEKYVSALFGSVLNYMNYQGNKVAQMKLAGIHQLEERLTESLLVNSVERNMIIEQERVLLVTHAIERFHFVYQRRRTTLIPHAYIILTSHPIYTYEGEELDGWAKVCAICRDDNYVFVHSTGYFQETLILLKYVLKIMGVGHRRNCHETKQLLLGDYTELPWRLTQCITDDLRDCLKDSKCDYIMNTPSLYQNRLPGHHFYGLDARDRLCKAHDRVMNNPKQCQSSRNQRTCRVECCDDFESNDINAFDIMEMSPTDAYGPDGMVCDPRDKRFECRVGRCINVMG